MEKNLSHDIIYNHLINSINSEKEFLNLKNLVFDFFYDEDDFLLKDNNLHEILSILCAYFEFYDINGDIDKNVKIKNLISVYESKNITPEAVLYALRYYDIKKLYEKYKDNKITYSHFIIQLKKISPVSLDWKLFLSLILLESK